MEKRRTNKRHMVCDACREAMRVQAAGYRKQRILNGARSVQRTPDNVKHYKLVGGHIMDDATGTRRRLMALSAMGWSLSAIGDRLGQHGNNFGFVIRKRKWVMPETSQKIRALYQELQMIPAPLRNDERGNGRAVVITRARRKGWLPPLCWDDDTMDDPYTLPEGMDDDTLWNWYCKTALEHERIEWVLENGIPQPPKPKTPSKKK
jgi:hypothetical protein